MKIKYKHRVISRLTIWIVSMQILSVLAAGLLWFYPIYALFIRSPLGSTNWLDWRVIAFGLMSQIFIHEAGHLIAGFMIGFRFFGLSVFPLQLARCKSGWVLTPFLSLGQAKCLPPQALLDSDLPKLRMLWLRHVVGGPLFGLLWSGVAITTWFYLRTIFPEDAAIVQAVRMSAIFGFILNLASMWPDGDASDGECVKILVRKDEMALAFTATLSVELLMTFGTRFDTFDKKCREIIAGTSVPPAVEINGLYHAYFAALSAGEIEEADQYMHRLQATGAKENGSSWMAIIQTELAFFSGFHRNDPIVARKCWAGSKAWTRDPLERARCEAAVLIAENKEDEARAVLRSVANDIKQLPSFEPMRLIVSDLRRISMRLGITDADWQR